MDFLKKLWIELNRVRRVEFISYETEEEANSRLSAEFEARKLEIAQQNASNMIDKLTQWEIDTCLHEQNYLIPLNQAKAMATARFIQAKYDGKLDELNSLKEGV